MFDEEGLEEVKKCSKTSIQMATHNFQKTLVSGLSCRDDVNLHIINIPPIGSYPINYKKLFIGGKHWGKDNYRIGCINVPFIKRILQKREVEKAILKYSNPNDDNIVLMYSLFEPFVYGAIRAKRHVKRLKICLLQTDALAGRNGQEKYDSKKKAQKVNRMIQAGKEIDSYILLTKHLKDVLEVGTRPNLVMEGICNQDQIVNQEKTISSNICLYLGTINEEYGIKEMVDAFIGFPEAQLWLGGSGDAVPYVKQVCKKYDNIKYLGFISGEEMIKVMDECDYLINPRKPTGTYTLYSFPSKTMEYLASGKPSIMYKLEGIPDEYDEYINYLSVNRPIREQLSAMFACNYEDMLCKAKRGCEFVRNCKNANVQTKRIVDFLKGII